MKLAKLGYCGGDPVKILQSPTKIVLGMLDYESYQDDYNSADVELNKEG
tara:strand:- start:1072 stop:1218 length:147 start_codon:yes stop_codon:yes gene_type:complete